MAVCCVYTRKAYPNDGRQMEMNVDDAVIRNAPAMADKRASLAKDARRT